MASLRLLPRDEWERRLTEQGCKRTYVEPSGLETGEWWVTEHDRLFVLRRRPRPISGAFSHEWRYQG